jgi:glycosyltransferase involved in cell wall biosynthesis
MQIVNAMHIGGAENVIFNLARAIDPSNFDVSVRCTRALGTVAVRLIDEGRDVRFVGGGRGAWRYLGLISLRREIDRWRPDVVHSHGLPAMLHTGPAALIPGAPPWVHTFHYGNYGGARHRRHRLERFFARRATRLITVSEVQKAALAGTYALAPESMTTIYNGVADNPLADDPQHRLSVRAGLGIAADEVVVGCVAVLSEQKGITYLLQAAPRLLAADPRIRVLIVGGGHLEEPLRREAAAIVPGDRVIFTGWREDALALLPAIDIFIMTSLWEAMPMVLLEAMAARRPIVVTDVGENRTVVENGHCAVLIRAADADAAAAAVIGLVRDPERARLLADRAHARYRERFTVAHMVRGYESVYASLAAGHRGIRAEAS